MPPDVAVRLSHAVLLPLLLVDPDVHLRASRWA